MSSPLLILAGMQKIDLVIKAMDDEAKAYEKKITEFSTKLEGVKGLIADTDKELADIAEVLGEVDLRITQSNERIKKNEERIRSVSGNKELKALNKETSTASKIIRQAEKDAAELKARRVEQGLLKEARELTAEGIKTEIESLRAELAEKGGRWQDELEGKKAERAALRADLSEGIYNIYERIRLSKGGTAVVPLRKEACQGCFMHVPTQLYVKLKRGDEEIIMCPHCDRILYVEDLPASAEAPSA
ncbi:MAG: zinc ribbon domain-containing protein [Thermodesulfobacteriota bacterium]